MPGNKSASSEVLTTWQELTLEESGGFAGLRRGATLERTRVDANRAARVARLLRELPPTGVSRQAAAQPDFQTLRVELCTPGGKHQWCFDTADLPEPVSELVALVPLRPLPPG